MARFSSSHPRWFALLVFIRGNFTVAKSIALAFVLGMAHQGCGGSSPATPTGPTAPASLTGTWVGNSPDGLVFVAGTFCDHDVTLNLTQSGNTVSGTFTSRARVTECTATSYNTLEQTTGQTSPAQITGTVDGRSVSLRILAPRSRNGTLNGFTYILADGTLTATRLTLSGIGTAATRQWRDANEDGVPNCDLLNPNPNGECGLIRTPGRSGGVPADPLPGIILTASRS